MNQALRDTLSFIAVLAFVFVASSGFVFYRDRDRPGAAALLGAQKQFAIAKAKFDDSSKAAKLPPLAQSWPKFTKLAGAFGLVITTDKDAVLRGNDGSTIAYTGASNGWDAVVTGDPADVLAFVRASGGMVPLVLNGVTFAAGDYTPGSPVVGNKMSAQVTVLGSL